MNIVNVDAVELFCESFADRAGQSAVSRAWMTRNLRKHVLRTSEFHVPVDGAKGVAEAMRIGLIDSVPDWLEDALKRGDPLAAFDPDSASVQAFSDQCERVADWLRATAAERGESSLSRMSFDEASQAAADWHASETARRVRDFAKQNNLTERQATALLAAGDRSVAALWKDDPDGIVIVSEPNATRLSVVRLLTKSALVREGTLLDHCVATYAERVAEGTCEIYSVRDADNMPLATAEVVPAGGWATAAYGVDRFLPPGTMVMVQARGRSNTKPSPDARARLREYLAANGFAATGVALATSGMGAFSELRLEARIDMGLLANALAASMRTGDRSASAIPREAMDMLRIAGDRLPELNGTARESLLQAFAPSADRLLLECRTRDVLGRKVERVRAVLPMEVFAPLGRYVRSLDEEAIAKDAHALAKAIIAEIRNRTTAAFDIVLPPAQWPSPEAFFAYAGVLPEWMDIRRKNIEARRAFLGELMAATRAALKARPDMPDDDRASLINFLNVEAPALRAA